MTQPAASSSAALSVTVDALAARLILLYTQAEQELLANYANLIETAPALTLLSSLRREAQRVAADLRTKSWPLAQQITNIAIRDGDQAALTELRRIVEFSKPIGDLVKLTPPLPPIDPSVGIDLAKRLEATLPRIVQSAEDAYRAATIDQAVHQLQHGATPQIAQRDAWRKLTERGITGFRDRAGRNWNLSTYVEMATRTGLQQAFNNAHLKRMVASGVEFFTVPSDGHPCPLCKPWQGRVLTVSGPSPTIAEAKLAGLFHPNCFPGGTVVSSPSGVRAADSRWYQGQLVVIHTASGQELSVTPNHPVLTPEGWVAAGCLAVGDNVLRHLRDIERMDGVSPDDQLVPTAIGKVFDALRQSSSVRSVSMPSTPEQFHGDGEGTEVQVVLTDRLLQDYGIDAQELQMLRQRALLGGGMGRSDLLSGGALDQVRLAARHAADSFMGSVAQGGSLCGRHAVEASFHRFAATELDASLEDPAADGGLSDAEGGRQLALSLASEVALDEIVDISTREHAGHVYNLQSAEGWYLAESIVVHNCRHTLVAYFPGISKFAPPEPFTAADKERYDATQKLRALERQVRGHKQAAAAALTPIDRKRAERRARQVQARIRTHIAKHGLNRRSRREQLDLGNS